MPKKTLTTKLSIDVTQWSTAQIEAFKAFMEVSFEPGGFGVSFEIEEQNEENWWQSMLQRIRDEFTAGEAALVNQLLSDENKASDESMIRVESQGKVLHFPGGDEAAQP